jgi:hypothetical protein
MDPTPPGFEDVPWLYPFPLPDQGSPSIYPISHFPLAFDFDADFLLRGMWGLASSSSSNTNSSLAVRLYDAYGNRMSDDLVPFLSLATPAVNYNYGFSHYGFVWSLLSPASLEPELFCPAGSAMQIDLDVLPGTPAGDSSGAMLYLFGVKRYKGCAA